MFRINNGTRFIIKARENASVKASLEFVSKVQAGKFSCSTRHALWPLLKLVSVAVSHILKKKSI